MKEVILPIARVIINNRQDNIMNTIILAAIAQKVSPGIVVFWKINISYRTKSFKRNSKILRSAGQ